MNSQLRSKSAAETQKQTYSLIALILYLSLISVLFVVHLFLIRHSVAEVPVAEVPVANAAQEIDTPEVHAQIVNEKGTAIGSVNLRQGSQGVVIDISVHDLPPGYHGMHFHTSAQCAPPDFKSAEGHVSPEGKPHGFFNPKGPHEGNLPNLVVGADGKAEVELYTDMISLRPNSSANLLDADGSALIIHTARDDHFTQPIGGSGGRIACASITKAETVRQ